MHEGIRVDARIVYYALLFHDAGYQHEHTQLGYATKEHYSAALAREVLARRKPVAALLKKVENAILSTMRGGRFVSAEQKAVRAADLAGLAASYDVFLGNTIRLWDEHEMLTGRRPEWGDWTAGTVHAIRYYLAREIRLTSYYMSRNGESAFHAQATANLQRLQCEPTPVATLRT